MDIVIMIYQKFTALDAIGPYEVLRSFPGANVKFAAREKGLITTDSKFLSINADYAIDEISSADILLIPGSPNPAGVMKDKVSLEWIKNIHAGTRWTVSVCTGSLILGAAGLLTGLKATTHWLTLDMLKEFNAEPVTERVVRQGKIITAAGVSAGIDMALQLAAAEFDDTLAKSIQLGIEYDPQPPFNAGSPLKAEKEIVEAVKKDLN